MKVKARRTGIWRWKFAIQAGGLRVKFRLLGLDLRRKLINLALFVLEVPDEPAPEFLGVFRKAR